MRHTWHTYITYISFMWLSKLVNHVFGRYSCWLVNKIIYYLTSTCCAVWTLPLHPCMRQPDIKTRKKKQKQQWQETINPQYQPLISNQLLLLPQSFKLRLGVSPRRSFPLQSGPFSTKPWLLEEGYILDLPRTQQQLPPGWHYIFRIGNPKLNLHGATSQHPGWGR